MSTASLSVGQKIELNDGRVAIVRFAGTTHFQTGDWVGVELDEATGKNDGSVKGERYFQCEQGYGMFLRPSGVRQVLEDAKSKAKTTGNGVTSKARPSSVHTGANGLKRQSVVDGPGRRASTLGASPTPGPRPGMSGIRSPAKSPTKQLGSNGVSSASTSRTNTPPVGRKPAAPTATTRSRQSLLPPSTAGARRTSAVLPVPTGASQKTSRQSLAPPGTGLRTTASRTAAGQASTSTTAPPTPSQQRLSSTAEEETSDDGSEQTPRESETSSQAGQSEANGEPDEDDTIRPNFAPPPLPPEPPQPSPTTSRSRRPSSPAAASIHSQRTIRSTAASNRQIEELEAKVRLLERKRLEDREVRKNLDQAVQERDQYKGIIEKLQTKYRPQHQENTELKQKLSEAEKRFAEVDSIQAEHDSAMEMATLDREMAEEKAEGLQDELDALRQHNEEMQLELEVLREEKDELTRDMSPEERASAGWVHLQTQNEKLTKALLALRDRFMDEKEDLNEQIRSLEDQVKDLDSLRAEHEDIRERLLRSEADTSDLRQQLEVALQAEEMIEGLSAQKERLQDSVHELHATIEDLENLKELNDELEINHVEAEKQMQEEIDFKDSLLIDRDRTVKLQQEALDDRDTIINQFRNYVRNLESDVADMRATKDITDAEAKALEGKSRAMIDLNMKLQSNAAKTQVKTIDLELRRLDAQEASAHLDIVKLFLPEAFDAERDSVLALLRFKRISFKANLVHEFIKERIASFNNKSSDHKVFAACDVVNKLTWIAAMAERFVNSIRSCTAEEFAKYDSALFELEPVERALDRYIDGLRRDEIKERDMAQELQRSIAVMSHLATIHVKDDLASHADHLLMRTQCLQSQLESAATALQLSKVLIESNVPNTSDEEEDDDEGSASDLAIILTRAETLMNHVRSAKVVTGKTYRSLTELETRHLTLEAACTESFDSTESIVTEAVAYTLRAGDALQALFGEEGRNEPFTPSEVSSALSRAAMAVFSLQAPEAGPYTALATRLRDLTDALTDLASLPTDLDNTVEFERAAEPWKLRARELKQSKNTSVDTEAELARALETLRGKDTMIKEKETELEEQSVRIEMLEARLKDASKRSAKIAELERNLHEAKDAEHRAKKDVERAKEERDRDVERAREEMGRLGNEKKKGAAGDLDADAMGAGARMTMKRQEHKISGLEDAVRYLKEENHRLRLPPPDSPLSAQLALDWLHQPLAKQKSDLRQRHETVLKEGKDLLQQMLSVASVPQTVDLTKMPENKLAWRPAKESSRWRVERRKEEWEMWKDWRKEVVLKGNGRLQSA